MLPIDELKVGYKNQRIYPQLCTVNSRVDPLHYALILWLVRANPFYFGREGLPAECLALVYHGIDGSGVELIDK